MKTPSEEFNAAVGRQLRGEIGAAGSSIAAMARDIGIARSALDNYVTGKRSIPVPVVYAVCAAVKVAPHVLLQRAEERLSTDSDQGAGVLTPFRRRRDVTGSGEDIPEVAFGSRVGHEGDTDDLYQ
ncbi:MAG: XRE family transcriptional regulator [Candidatus Microbacterium colombiense]|nr:MAG: XRE family transcriptional regulator [Microbacterium sp.]